jgi:hypothetical protein
MTRERFFMERLQATPVAAVCEHPKKNHGEGGGLDLNRGDDAGCNYSAIVHAAVIRA